MSNSLFDIFDDDRKNISLKKLKASAQQMTPQSDSVKKTNILLMGASGSGKSSLINALFGSDIVKTGQGKPITQHLEKIPINAQGFTLWDTKGIEAADYVATKGAIEKELTDAFENHISEDEVPLVAILCIKENSHRTEDREFELLRITQKFNIPTIVVFTDTFKREENNNFVEIAKEELNKEFNNVICNRYVRVNSVEYNMEFDDQVITIKKKGLDELVDIIDDTIPEGRNNFRKYQIVNIKKRRKAVIESAEEIVNYAAISAAGVGLIPVPGSDALFLSGIQGTMIYKITTEFGLDTNDAMISSLVTGVLGITAVAQVGRAAASGLLKFIPGIGSVAGAATAAAITKVIGNAYIKVLSDFYDNEKGKVVLPNDSNIVLEAFKKYFKQGETEKANNELKEWKQAKDKAQNN